MIVKSLALSRAARRHSLRLLACALSLLLGLCSALAGTVTSGTVHAAGSQTTWQHLSPAASPSARANPSMAYDAATHQLLLFAGSTSRFETSSTLLDDTWSWDGSTWSQLSPATSPPSRANANMAYDAATGQLVLFGGFNGSGALLNDTWTWDGSTWQQLGPAVSPPGVEDASMAFDSTTRQLLLFDGSGTWNWTGSTWQQVSTTGPSSRQETNMADDPTTGQFLLFGGYNGGSYLGDTWNWDGSAWTQLSPAASPSARSNAGMAFDPATGQFVLFGGTNGLYRADTWSWDGSTWQQLSTAISPSGRDNALVAFDTATGQFLLFGGLNGSGALFNDTWVYGLPTKGALWSRLSPAVSPSARYTASAAFDPATGQLLLFGGVGTADTTGDTWNWDGKTWQQLSTSGPAGRWGASMAFDPATGQLLLFGGEANNDVVGDTWGWDGKTWQQLSTSGPAARYGASMAFDPATGQLLLFGGDSHSGIVGDTWGWDGKTWQQLSTTGPAVRLDASMAFDAATGQLLLFGGANLSSGALGDTWSWDGKSWQQLSPTVSPPSRASASMAFDPTIGQLLLFGGDNGSGADTFGDTWSWDGTSWTPLNVGASPSRRYGAAMIFDSVTGQIVLFGGFDGANEVGDTWTYAIPATGADWGQVSPAASPPARSYANMDFDPATGQLLLFGGEGANRSILGDTWNWDGSTWQQLSTTGPAARSDASMAFDPASGQLLLFGANFTGDDTWNWNGKTWQQLSPVASPFGRDGASMAFDPATGQLLLFGGMNNNIPLGDTWNWDGKTWRQLSPPASPPARWGASMAFDPATGQLLLFGGNSNGTALADTWSWDGSTWTQLKPASSPPTHEFAAMAFAPATGQLLLFGGESSSNSSGKALADTWSWDGSTWTQLSPATSPSARDFSSMAFDPATGQLLLFGGNSNGTALGDTWTYVPVIASRPTSLTAISGSGAYGSTATLTATLNAGSTPLSGQTIAFTLNGTPVGSATTGGTGVATLANVSLTGINAGSYAAAVGATFAVSGVYLGSSGTGSLQVAKAGQTIAFGTLPNKTYGDPAFTVNATASSGLPVSFSVGNTDQCTIAGNTVTITGAGSCTVTASQPGDSNDNAASVARTFQIARQAATIALNAASLRATYDGNAHNATASTVPSGLSYSVTYTDAGNNPVSNPINAGAYTATATITDPNYQGSAAVRTLVIDYPIPTISGLSQTATTAGTASLPLKVAGTNIVAGVSQVDWNGSAISGATYLRNGSPVTSGLADEIDVHVPGSDLTFPRPNEVTVVNPVPGGGPSAAQIVYVTPAGVTITTSNQATSTSAGGSAVASVGGSGAGSSGSLSATGSGQGAVAVAQYSTNPETIAPPMPVNAYFDVYVPTLSSFTSLKVKDCNLGGGSVVYYWTGSMWLVVSIQIYDPTTGCVTLDLSRNSVPSITQLAGTPFGVENVPPVVADPGAQSVQYGQSLSFNVSATDVEPGDTVTLSASGLPAGLSLGPTTFNATTKQWTATVSGTATAPAGTYTANITANDGVGTSAAQSVSIAVTKAPLTITANNQTMVLNGTLPALTVGYSGFVNGDTSGVVSGLSCSTTASAGSPVGSYPITCGSASATNYTISYVTGTLTIRYAGTASLCDGSAGHAMLQPINPDGTSVFKVGRTVPAKFRVCDANGVSIGTAGVVKSFLLVKTSANSNATVDETVNSTTPDTAFRWDATNEQWVFNMSTKGLTSDTKYFYEITLNDGTTIDFSFAVE